MQQKQRLPITVPHLTPQLRPAIRTSSQVLDRVTVVAGEVHRGCRADDDDAGAAHWEAQSVLLLWLSMLTLAPFELVVLDSSVVDGAAAAAARAAGYPPIAARMLCICKGLLQHPGARSGSSSSTSSSRRTAVCAASPQRTADHKNGGGGLGGWWHRRLCYQITNLARSRNEGLTAGGERSRSRNRLAKWALNREAERHLARARRALCSFYVLAPPPEPCEPEPGRGPR